MLVKFGDDSVIVAVTGCCGGFWGTPDTRKLLHNLATLLSGNISFELNMVIYIIKHSKKKL